MKRWAALLLALCMLLPTAACGHKHKVEYIEGTTATCERSGSIAHWKCRDCGMLFADEAAETALPSVETSPLGHRYSDPIVRTPATCTQVGESVARCMRCGTNQIVVSEALGHSFNAFRPDVAPTCLAEGSQTRYCTRCYFVEERAVPRLGHTFDVQNRCTFCQMQLVASDLIYEEKDGAYLISGATSELETLTIAPYYRGKPVTEIANGAFLEMRSLKELDCYAKLKIIGQSAFRNCENLTVLTIPDSVTHIGDLAFYSCHALQSLHIGSGLEYLGQSVFYGCSGLREITGASERYTARDNCLYAGNTLVLGSNGATRLSGAKEIAANAFYGMTQLNTITIDHTLERIGDFAFLGCERLQTILFEGSAAEWEAIEKGKEWNRDCPAAVICSENAA